MRKSFSVPAFLFSAIIALGCSMAKYPIDDPATEKIDKRLLGEWRDDKISANSYTLTAKDETHYNLSVLESNNDLPSHYTAFISRIDGAEFLNVNYKDDSVNGYFFLRILDLNKAADKAQVTEVHEDSVLHTLASPAAVRKWIQANLNNPGFYSDTGKLHKSHE